MNGYNTKKQFDGTDNKEKIAATNATSLTTEEDQGEIDVNEVQTVIKKLKKIKAGGEDKIPNEAWIYGGSGKTK